ncbi:MAG TPA: adenylate/guanylate cyclase domain-containing protein [Candidatus Binataceae bacterium]|nr:adenylate/guanylate cyclase domain-containing protein [Candidatus Binataceae bacterium]
MTYRLKLFLLLSALVAITNGLLAYVNYQDCQRLLRTEIHRKVRAVASTTALLIDSDLVAAAESVAHSGARTPQYTGLMTLLRSIRDANRRDDVWVDRIFVLVPARENAKALRYALDTEEHFEYRHQPGDVYKQNGRPVLTGLAGIDKQSQDLANFPAGYTTAFAPVSDASSKLIAELGVTVLPAPASTISSIGRAMALTLVVILILTLGAAAILSHQVTHPLYSLRASIDAIGKGNFDVHATANTTVEFTEMAAAINAMATGLRERDHIKRAFSGYISRQMMELIVSKGELPGLKGERRRITVLFSDIRGFTSIAEGMRPEEVVEMLSEFFSRMVDVVLRNHGTIDKFLGDGVMVIFGAPLDDPYQEEHAVIAAVEMQRELETLCAKWDSEGRRRFKMGIGINSGSAVVGNIGSQEHMEYTAIGDTVNLAARLESATKELDVDIIVSEHTYDSVRPLFKWKPIGPIVVKGRLEPVHAFAVEGLTAPYHPTND